jgi:hypothetical protein
LSKQEDRKESKGEHDIVVLKVTIVDDDQRWLKKDSGESDGLTATE